MKIRIFDCIDDFEYLKENWEYVFKNDTKATVFQSWNWFRGWFEINRDNWLIIAVRPDYHRQYIAFLTLHKESITGKYGMRNHHILNMAGEPLIDYTGLLCLHQYESEVIEELARFLQQDTHWNKFKLREVCDNRVVEITRRFEARKYSVQYKKETPCPRLNLPNTWEKYVSGVLDPKFSKKLIQKMRKAENKGCYISEANDENFELYLQYYFQLHEMRWGKIDKKMRELFISTLTWAYYSNFLRIDVLWYTDAPIAIQVSFLDTRNKIFHFYNGGWDPDYANLSPGVVLHGHCIRYAIENGYKVYDFMRGGEAYKYLFGSIDVFNKNIIITVNTIETKLRKIKNRIVGRAAKR